MRSIFIFALLLFGVAGCTKEEKAPTFVLQQRETRELPGAPGLTIKISDIEGSKINTVRILEKEKEIASGLDMKLNESINIQHGSKKYVLKVVKVDYHLTSEDFAHFSLSRAE